METAYVKKSTDNSVAQTKKKCELSEAELKHQIEVCKCLFFVKTIFNSIFFQLEITRTN
jgi:hypothetical protein